MTESFSNPFFSLLFTAAKAISKFKAVTELRWEGDDYRVQQYSAYKPKHFPLRNAMAHTLQAFRSVLPTASGSLLSWGALALHHMLTSHFASGSL